jgi:hypothetical protein
VRCQVIRSSTTQVWNSDKVLSSDSGKESGTVSYKGPGKRPGKILGKEAGQDNVQDRDISLLWGQSELKEEI